MAIHLNDSGVKFDSTGRVLGKFTSPAVGAFLLGWSMWGVVSEDGQRVWFVRPIADLSKTEREELADYVIGQWRRFREMEQLS